MFIPFIESILCPESVTIPCIGSSGPGESIAIPDQQGQRYRELQGGFADSPGNAGEADKNTAKSANNLSCEKIFSITFILV